MKRVDQLIERNLIEIFKFSKGDEFFDMAVSVFKKNMTKSYYLSEIVCIFDNWDWFVDDEKYKKAPNLPERFHEPGELEYIEMEKLFLDGVKKYTELFTKLFNRYKIYYYCLTKEMCEKRHHYMEYDDVDEFIFHTIEALKCRRGLYYIFLEEIRVAIEVSDIDMKLIVFYQDENLLDEFHEMVKVSGLYALENGFNEYIEHIKT